MKRFISCFFCFFILLSIINVANSREAGVGEGLVNGVQCQYFYGISGYNSVAECMDAEKAKVDEVIKANDLKFDAAQKQKLAGAISNPISKLKEAASPIGEKLKTYATSLFWILVLITGAYQFAFMVLKRSDLGEYFAEVVKFTITIGFFYWLLKNGTDIGIAIFDGFSTNLAKKVSDLDATPTGIVLASADIFSLMSDTKYVSKVLPYTWIIFALKIFVGAICVVLLAIVAINYAILQATAYLVLLLGVIVLGFGGSNYTRDWALTYFRSALSQGIKLLIMTLIVATGLAVLKSMTKLEGDSVTAVGSLIMLVTVVLLFKVSSNVPDIVSSFIGNAGAGAKGINPTGAAAVAAMAAPVAAIGTAAKMTDALAKGNLTMGQVGKSLAAAIASGGKTSFSQGITGSIEKNMSQKAETAKNARAEAQQLQREGNMQHTLNQIYNSLSGGGESK